MTPIPGLGTWEGETWKSWWSLGSESLYGAGTSGPERAGARPGSHRAEEAEAGRETRSEPPGAPPGTSRFGAQPGCEPAEGRLLREENKHPRGLLC